MMKNDDYAIVLIGGKQYRVAEGDELTVEKLEGKTFKFDQVLLSSHKKKITVGTPYVAKAVVKASLIDQTKGEKIRVARFKAKSRYRRVTGHRQQLTKIKIDKIQFA